MWEIWSSVSRFWLQCLDMPVEVLDDRWERQAGFPRLVSRQRVNLN